jgi:hypothetical protein
VVDLGSRLGEVIIGRREGDGGIRETTGDEAERTTPEDEGKEVWPGEGEVGASRDWRIVIVGERVGSFAEEEVGLLLDRNVALGSRSDMESSWEDSRRDGMWG